MATEHADEQVKQDRLAPADLAARCWAHYGPVAELADGAEKRIGRVVLLCQSVLADAYADQGAFPAEAEKVA